MVDLRNCPSKLPTHRLLYFSINIQYVSGFSCCSKTLQCCCKELAPLCWNCWIYLFNVRGPKSKICRHKRNHTWEKGLIHVTLIVHPRAFTRGMVSKSSLCNSRNHNWLLETYWQIHPTRAEIFPWNNHTWCQRERLITVNIYVWFYDVMTSGRCCSSY